MNVMSFPTLLSEIGKILKGVIGIATAAEPIIAVAVPTIAPLYVEAIKLAGLFEAAFGAGAGPAKLAAFKSAIAPTLAAAGITMTDEQLTAWSNAVVLTLNLLPPPTAKS